MSIDHENPGGKTALADAAAEAKRLLDEAAAEEREAEQLDLEPITAEEAAEAYEALGAGAKPLAVLRHVREERKRGRPRNVRNRRTVDTIKYLSQFGPDPLVAMMKIVGESEEAMIARSEQVDPVKKRMSYAEARAMRIRCAETLAPYFHGKQPVQVDHTIKGVTLISQIGEMRSVGGSALGGAVKGVLPYREDGEGDDG